jgi:hypothetical protein
MMNQIIIASPQLLEAVCGQIRSVQCLARFAQVNKTTGNYLMGKSGGRHWTDVGRLTVGDAYWVVPPNEEEDSARYYTKLQICPWVSAVSKIPIEEIGLARRNGEEIYVKELRIRAVGDDVKKICAILRTETMDPYVMAVVKQTSFVEIAAVGDYVESRNPAHDTRRRGFTRADAKLYPRVEEAYDVLPFDLRRSGWDENFVNRVFSVHHGVFAVVQLRQYEDNDTDTAIVHFMSYRTNRILHTLALATSGSRGVLFLPGGRMYLANGEGVDYYGPRKDRRVSE